MQATLNHLFKCVYCLLASTPHPDPPNGPKPPIHKTTVKAIVENGLQHFGKAYSLIRLFILRLYRPS